MEKPDRSIITFLPKLATGRENPMKPRANGQSRSFSGPITVSIIPVEARRQKESGGGDGGGFEAPQEPTSPKVTCMGQIKLEKMTAGCGRKPSPPRRKWKLASLIREVFRRPKVGPAGGGGKSRPPVSAPPSLRGMRRSAGGRNSLGDFDWRRAVEAEEVIIAHSAPIMVGGGVVAVEPRKVASLWKKRTSAPLTTLQLN
ncbi:hypothetical protein BHE74_00008112 [Ensete ventricosum]|nr:hypothetical protein GW17_00028116 [Ensete ventricosum]RWW83384.1 hypothetical protein BHE74_00008112 [Ensete ventricosum]RZR97952.1 hypothetical protein BHM03_00027235 [Ensete ventricosum]